MWGGVSGKLRNWGRGIKGNENRMGDSNLPRIEKKGLQLGFPRHLGKAYAALGHRAVRQMLLTC